MDLIEKGQAQIEPANGTDVGEVPEINEVPLPTIPQRVHDQPVQVNRPIYPTKENVKRPNPLLEPSSFSQTMAKQLPKYEGLLNPQPIEIELRGRLPSYDVDKAIEKYPFTMDSFFRRIKRKEKEASL